MEIVVLLLVLFTGASYMVLLASVWRMRERTKDMSETGQAILAQVADLRTKVAESTTLIAKVAVDVQTLTDRLGNGDVTKDEAAAIANELGGVSDQLNAVVAALSALDEKTPDPVTPPAEPPVEEPTEPAPTDPTDPPAEPTEPAAETDNQQ